MCCGGGPLICDDYIDPQKKTCEQKYFCKSNQYATGVTSIPSGDNQGQKVAGNCVNCPPGATCDGTSAVKCDDPNASFKAGKCGKPGATKATDKPGTTKATDKPGTTKATDKPGTTKATDKPGTTKTTDKPVADKPVTDKAGTTCMLSNPIITFASALLVIGVLF